MVNEEIITALKNAVDRGEQLDSAVNTIINSGYNPKEVKEAANFISYGVSTYLQPKPEEHLAMPSQKNFFGKIVQKPVKPQTPIQPRPQPQKQFPIQQPSQTQQPPRETVYKPISQPIEITKPEEPIIKKSNYTKEIILIIILLLLLGVLISTIIFKDAILNFIQGFQG